MYYFIPYSDDWMRFEATLRSKRVVSVFFASGYWNVSVYWTLDPGILGHFLHRYKQRSSWPKRRDKMPLVPTADCRPIQTYIVRVCLVALTYIRWNNTCPCFHWTCALVRSQTPLSWWK